MPYSSASTYISPTLHIATYRVARLLGGVTEGIATGGTTTSLTDTRVLALSGVDHYNDGMVWILRDSAEAAAAPEGEFGEISDDDGAGVLTVRDISVGSGNPFSAAPASGDRYAVTTGKLPPHQLISAVNGALQDMGVIPYVDISSITTASAQTEYSLPIAGNMDLREVYLQGKLSDTNDYRWTKIQSWHIQRTAIGTADLLVLPFQYVTGRLLKLVYMQEHPELDDASDKISESVHLNRLVTEAAFRMLESRDAGVSNDPNIERQMSRFLRPGADGLNRLERMRAQHAIYAPPRQAGLLILGRRIKPDRFTYPDPA
jgi:hypothetical protein